VLVSCGVENCFRVLGWIHSNGWDRESRFRGMSTSMLRGLKVERRSESGGAARKVEGRVVARWYKDMLVDPSIWWHEGIRFPFCTASSTLCTSLDVYAALTPCKIYKHNLLLSGYTLPLSKRG
jgi:hypothetical protein